ncbi:MAG: Translation initiation factor 2 subunit alpha [Candidatus Heimdallarchaeota archaeon LC_2]|nr:MAG: Translation initiation factor 2 subunit alpha [Candidatus Heimdallarchaeota archaeon LC_2]
MSVLSRKSLPESQDLVIGVVSKIQRHGVYITLKEFDNLIGYCHISEVAGAWIRNIRNFVRLDQTVVAKVLRVQEDTGQVDISLKRVSDGQKREKSLQYKRQNASLAMIKIIGEKSNLAALEVREIIEDQFTEFFGSLYDGFEEIVAVGLESISDFTIDDELKNIILEVAEASIQITTVTFTINLRIRSYASDGIVHIRKLLEVAQKAADEFPDVKNEITTIGAPTYRIYLEGLSYPEIDDVYHHIQEKLENVSKDLDVEYLLEKEGNK